ncbi:sensor histidine kinase [Streptacidiphilus carbonis]|uniref:sensor histidine kinase n=1 Tax=Streptacidiphilus carbonis TaxID=105422 RepID=UPI0005A739AE|nr:sensor histidine kinase [Streptacidiphilus carbonis]
MVNAVRAWFAHHVRLGDIAPGLLVVVVALVVSAVTGGNWHTPEAGGVLLTALACAPLLFRSRWPVPVAAATAALDILHLALDHGSPLVPAATMVAVYSMAARTPRRTAWITGGLAALAVTVVAAVTTPATQTRLASLVLLDLLVAAAAVGIGIRRRRMHLAAVEERAARAERSREEEARRRVADERVRIARELHDVVAHHITLVNAQAGVAHHLLRTDPEAAYEALAHIKETSRTALDELRATVGLLRQNDDQPDSREPLPGLDDLDRLVTSFRKAGLPVRLHQQGVHRRPAPAVDLTVYRIVQEALTNARKHAPGRTVELTLGFGADALSVTVANEGPAARVDAPGTGHGLIGMRERAATVGGTLTAGPDPDGGFLVRAELPLLPVLPDLPVPPVLPGPKELR